MQIHERFVQLGAEADSVTIVVKEPLAYERRFLEVQNVRLTDLMLKD